MVLWVHTVIDMTQSKGVGAQSSGAVSMHIFHVESSVVGLTSWCRFCFAFKKCLDGQLFHGFTHVLATII